jgi:polar amino acid transport system substrate-binding protein
MSDHRRRVGVLATGAVSMALLVNPLAAVAQDDAAMTALSPECATDLLPTKTEGVLTIGVDNPAFPPWYVGDPPEGSDWAFSDPTTGEGYEGATVKALAEVLGFTPEQVAWQFTPFGLSYAPGDKDFDVYVTQVSYKPERAEGADFSDSYYDVNQAVVTLADSTIAGATTITELKDAQLGAQVGTTSYDVIIDVIQPNREPLVFDDNDKALNALKVGSIDGIVVDMPTSFFMMDVQIPEAGLEGAVVGQFPNQGEYFGMLLEKDSELTACINEAISALKADGTLDALEAEWLAAPPPELAP